jgi:hypothetical protein
VTKTRAKPTVTAEPSGSLALEGEQRIGVETGGGERGPVRRRVATPQRQHREALVFAQKTAVVVAEREVAGRRRRDLPRIDDGEQFQEASPELDQEVAGAERVDRVRRRGKPQRFVGGARRVEIVDAEHQVIEGSSRRRFRHRALHMFEPFSRPPV